MKILFLSQYFYPEQFSNSRIATGLVDRGMDVEVICCVPNYPKGVFYEGYSNSVRRREVWNGVTIHRVLTIPRGNRALKLIFNYLAYAFLSPFKAIQLTIRRRPGVVFVSLLSPITQAFAGIVVKRIFHVPLVYWVQDIWPESATVNYNISNPFIVRSLSWVCGWIYRQADLIYVQSNAFPPMISRFGVAEDKIRIFPNSAATFYRPVNRQEAENEAQLVPGSGFKIMFAGNIGASQGFESIVEVAEILKSHHTIDWIIIGEGRELNRVRSLVREKGLDDQFHFLGRHPEERMPFFFAHADAMLVTLAKSEIFSLTVPYKVQGYLACAKPIVGSLEGEGARIVKVAGAGVTAPPGKAAQLAREISNLIEMGPETLSEMGKNALEFYRKNYEEKPLLDKLSEDLVQLSRETGKR